MIALGDCLGPKVLKGLKMVTLVLNDLRKEIQSWSAADLLAAYVDCE